MSSRIILLDGVDSKYSVCLATNPVVTHPGLPRLLITYHTDRLEHSVVPRVATGAVLRIQPTLLSLEGVNEATAWIKQLLKDDDRLETLLTEVLDFCEEHDNANSAIYQVIRIDVIGVGTDGDVRRLMRLNRDLDQSRFELSYEH